MLVLYRYFFFNIRVSVNPTIYFLSNVTYEFEPVFLYRETKRIITVGMF